MREQAGNVVEVSGSNRSLGLYNLNRIGNPSFKALASKLQRFACDLSVIAGHLHLTGRCLQIEKRIANFAFNAGTGILEFGAALIQSRLRLLYIAFCPSASPDWNAQRAGNRKRPVRLGRPKANSSVIGVDGQRWVTLSASCGTGSLGCQ